MPTLKILTILESSGIEHRQTIAIAECIELAFQENETRLSKQFTSTPHLALLGTDFKNSSVGLRAEMKSLTAEIRCDLIHFKNDIIRWMFILWVAQIAATTALVKLLIP
jgi:hypothetical protein